MTDMINPKIFVLIDEDHRERIARAEEAKQREQEAIGLGQLTVEQLVDWQTDAEYEQGSSVKE